MKVFENSMLNPGHIDLCSTLAGFVLSLLSLSLSLSLSHSHLCPLNEQVAMHSTLLIE